MKPIEVKGNTYINFIKDVNEKDPKFKVGDHVRISKYKKMLLKDILQIGLKKFFLIKEVNYTVPWIYVINDLNGEKIIGTFYEKELQKPNQQGLAQKKSLKDKEINYMPNGKDMIIHLIAGLIKMILYNDEPILS